MTQEEVMQIMTDMGLHEGGMDNWVADNAWWKFANVMAQHEREECAKLADEYIEGCEGTNFGVGKAIRARGQPQVCCEEYNICVRPCTPRGRHHGQEAEREAILELVDSYAHNNTDLVKAIRARGQA